MYTISDTTVMINACTSVDDKVFHLRKLFNYLRLKTIQRFNARSAIQRFNCLPLTLILNILNIPANFVFDFYRAERPLSWFLLFFAALRENDFTQQ